MLISRFKLELKAWFRAKINQNINVKGEEGLNPESLHFWAQLSTVISSTQAVHGFGLT